MRTLIKRAGLLSLAACGKEDSYLVIDCSESTQSSVGADEVVVDGLTPAEVVARLNSYGPTMASVAIGATTLSDTFTWTFVLDGDVTVSEYTGTWVGAGNSECPAPRVARMPIVATLTSSEGYSLSSAEVPPQMSAGQIVLTDSATPYAFLFVLAADSLPGAFDSAADSGCEGMTSSDVVMVQATIGDREAAFEDLAGDLLAFYESETASCTARIGSWSHVP